MLSARRRPCRFNRSSASTAWCSRSTVARASCNCVRRTATTSTFRILAEFNAIQALCPNLWSNYPHRTPVPPLFTQLLTLLLLAIPIASVAWTVTHEEVFREPREFCKQKSESETTILRRKFFYLFTCEYCFSHYIAAAFLFITRFHLLYPDWRGYLVSLFSLVWVANSYMGVFAHLRLDIRHERIEIQSKDIDLQHKETRLRADRAA
jgi:hypothetical protein